MTSFKRDGTGVATPVWFVSDGTRLFAFTDLHSAKIWRIRRNPRVLVASCWVAASCAASRSRRARGADRYGGLGARADASVARYKISYRVVMFFYRLDAGFTASKASPRALRWRSRSSSGEAGTQMSTVSTNQTEEVVHVGGPRPTPRQLAREVRDVALALPLFATAPLLRHWHRRWGATDAEVAAAMPGDELVPGSQIFCTRAITIDAPPEAVWPWLVQVGFGKAGFYSNDLLDNLAHPSASRILEEFQDPKVGDWVPMSSKVNDTTAFKIAAIRPPEELVWAKPDSTWAWTLTDIGGALGWSRGCGSSPAGAGRPTR